MSIEQRVTHRVVQAVSRRRFLRRSVGWGVAAGFAMSGASALLTTVPARAISCSETDDSNNDACSCTTCGTFCSGCNGSEDADGCPSGYNPDRMCTYPDTGCWCTKNCCVKRTDGSYQRRRRTCCDCMSGGTDFCTCRGQKQWGASCNEQQWQLDGLIIEGSLLDQILDP